MRRTGLRSFLTVSGASAAAGLALIALALGHHSYPLMLAGLLLAGYGTATGVFAATVSATQGVADAEQGLASGLINMSRQVGAAVGVAVSAAVIGSSAASRNSVTADRGALLVTAAAAVLAAAIALRGIGARSTRAAMGANSPNVPPRRRSSRHGILATGSQKAGKGGTVTFGHPNGTFSLTAERAGQTAVRCRPGATGGAGCERTAWRGRSRPPN